MGRRSAAVELQPPVSETLIEADEFAATFDALVAETYSDDDQAENRRRRLERSPQARSCVKTQMQQALRQFQWRSTGHQGHQLTPMNSGLNRRQCSR